MKKDKLAKRIIELDILRGIAVILMMLDHLMYDFIGILPMVFKDYPFDLYYYAQAYWNWDVRIIVRYFVLFIFLGISGICCSFSKSNLSRGIKLMIFALLLTLATNIIGRFINDPELMITFGVLHCIALSLILIGLLEKVTSNKWIYLAIGLIMVSIGLYLHISPEYGNYQYYGDVPMYQAILEQIVGINKYGGDCFPLLLHGGQIFIGVFLGKLLYANKKSLFKNAKYKNNVLTFIGRNSLIVYFAHQIILPVLAGLVLLILGYSLNI